MRQIDKLETDFFGDLNQDVHGIWEIFEFVRYHFPNNSDDRVLEIGFNYLNKWISYNWIIISKTPIYPSTINSLIDCQKQLKDKGKQATKYFENAPSIELSTQAYNDIEWLRGS